VFPSGLTIGIDSASNPPYDATWTIAGKATQGRQAECTGLKCYLRDQSGPSGALTADTLNATSTSGGTLAAQVATLALNIGFDGAGVLPNGSQEFGHFVLCNLVAGSQIGSFTLTAVQATALNGTPVSQVLADANTALGTNVLPSYVSSFGDLNQLVTALNESFDNCLAPSAFALANLCVAP